MSLKVIDKDVDIETEEDLDVEVTQYDFEARCDSPRCMGVGKMRRRRHGASFDGVTKRVPRSVNFCPDCDYALFWVRIPKGSSAA